jgi:hypothetical protein
LSSLGKLFTSVMNNMDWKLFLTNFSS